MSSHDTEKEAIEAAVLTDIDGNPITCDKNPAHFDGFLTEVAAYIGRTGKWLPLVEQGVSIRGHRTVVDSPAAVPFVQGSIAGARVYSPDDPCPPTAARVADHNAAAAAAGTPGIAPRTGGMAIPDFTVNEYVVKQDDLSLGNAIASCFVGYSDFINRLRETPRHGRPRHDLDAQGPGRRRRPRREGPGDPAVHNVRRVPCIAHPR